MDQSFDLMVEKKGVGTFLSAIWFLDSGEATAETQTWFGLSHCLRASPHK